MRVSVVGMGKLGCSILAAVASRGFEVFGVDVRDDAVASLGKGVAPVYEVALQETISANATRIHGTRDHALAIAGSDITFVIVPTPSDSSGGFSLDHVQKAFRDVGLALRKKKGFHVVVLKSTVLPGSCRYALVPVLEEVSGKKAGEEFGFCYSPEFIKLGGVVQDFLNPDFRLIGEHDPRAGTVLKNFYEALLQPAVPCRRMSLENAELCKVALDAFITTKISFANTIADICERIPGGDADAVSDVLGLDPRIGRKCLTGGAPYGGPCFPRDSVAFSRLAQILGTRSPVSEATDEVNRAVRTRLTERVLKHALSAVRAGIIGLAFKPGSDVIEHSDGMHLARVLLDHGVKVLVHDKLVPPTVIRSVLEDVEIAQTVEQCIASTDLVVLTLPDSQLRDVPKALFKGKTVIDFWRILRDKLSDRQDVKYLPVGQTEDSCLLQEYWSPQYATVRV